jgi:hypothetical protein
MFYCNTFGATRAIGGGLAPRPRLIERQQLGQMFLKHEVELFVLRCRCPLCHQSLAQPWVVDLADVIRQFPDGRDEGL